MSSLPIESGKVVGLDCSQGESKERTMEDREYRKRIGFVRQQDFLVEHLTGKHEILLQNPMMAKRFPLVRETLYFVNIRPLFPARSTMIDYFCPYLGCCFETSLNSL
jgi:hypothetical protein